MRTVTPLRRRPSSSAASTAFAALAAFATLALLLPACAWADGPPSAPATTTDPWWGRDKALHFGGSLVLASSGYAIASTQVSPRWARFTLGVGSSVAIGAGKELLDLAGYGDPSWKDFTWDVLGALVGASLALSVDAIVGKKRAPETSPAAEGRTGAVIAF